MYRVIVLSALGVLALTGCNRSNTEKPAANKAPQAEPAPAKLTDEQMRDRLDETIQFTLDRTMKAEEQAAWQIVHGILAFGPKLTIVADGNHVSAMNWLLGGGKLKGWWLRPSDHGVQAVLEAGSKTGQGHQDQWLGYLCQCGAPIDTPVVVDGQTYTIKDMLTQAQWDCAEGMEAGWTLMAASTYLPLDAKWQAKDGKEWSTEKLLKMEVDADLADAACGGTHRMSGIAMAVKRKQAEANGRELTGVWKEAEDHVNDCVDKAKRFQQPDGTFSANFFIRASAPHEIADQLHCLGHTFEFVVYAVPKERLSEAWIEKAAIQLCDLLDLTRDQALECGALYHAAHGLLLYRQERFGSKDYQAPTGVAAAAPETTVQAQP